MSLQSRAKRRLAAGLRRLARRLSRWADATDRSAAPPPTPAGGPPEHWLAVVREKAPHLLEGRGLGYKLDPGPRAWRAAPRPPDDTSAPPPATPGAPAPPAPRPVRRTAAPAPDGPTGAGPAPAAAWRTQSAAGPQDLAATFAADRAPAAVGPERGPTGPIEHPGPGLLGPVERHGHGPSDRPGPHEPLRSDPAAGREAITPGEHLPPLISQVRRLSVRQCEILDAGEATRASRPSFEWPRLSRPLQHRPAWPRLHERPPEERAPEPQAVAVRPSPPRADEPPAVDDTGHWPALPDDGEQQTWSPGLARLDPERARRLDREQRGL